MSVTEARVGGRPENFLVEETGIEKVRARPALRRKNCQHSPRIRDDNDYELSGNR